MLMAVKTSVKMKQQVLLVCFTVLVCSVQFVSSDDKSDKSVAPGPAATAPSVQDPANAVNTKPTNGDSENAQRSAKPRVTSADNNNATNCEGNSTECSNNSYYKKFSDLYEKGTIKRAFYVLIGITAVVVIYFVIRTVR